MSGGRPRKEIDLELAEKLANIQCTMAEIAEIVGVHESTLSRNPEFRKVYKRARERGKASLRRMQWKAAERGKVAILIWLGKQYLGQRDDPVDEDEDGLDELSRFIEDMRSERDESDEQE